MNQRNKLNSNLKIMVRVRNTNWGETNDFNTFSCGPGAQSRYQYLSLQFQGPLYKPFFTMPMIYLCFFLQSDQAIPGQTTVLVVVEGLVKYDGHKIHRFSQNFLLTAEGGTVWKVASDCFRFIQWRTWWNSTAFYWSCANIYLNHWFDWGMHTLYNGVLHVAPMQEMRCEIHILE